MIIQVYGLDLLTYYYHLVTLICHFVSYRKLEILVRENISDTIKILLDRVYILLYVANVSIDASISFVSIVSIVACIRRAGNIDTMTEKKQYTITQAAEICAVARSTMWRWVKSGRIRAAATFGKHHRISRDDLLKFMEQNKMNPCLRSSTAKNRILIVDDDLSIREMLGQALIDRGYEVEYAADGFDAGQKTIKFQPRLIILDMVLPRMDGYEVCRCLKEDPDTAKIKIIAISGFDTEDNRQRIFNCGADLFLPKPIDIKTFLKEIRNFLPKSLEDKAFV
jgi:excisionase family DNA binding protein